MPHDDPYANAALYDLEYHNHTEDQAYYLQLATSLGGPVLELGCGTGRLTLPIARAGVAIDGIDLAPGMLEGLRLKVAAEPSPIATRIRFFEADFRALPDHLQRDYPLVMWPFNALHHCRSPADVVRTLQGMIAHLKPGGRIALDVYLPDRELYDRDPNATYEHRIFQDPRSGQPLHTWEQGWWDEANRTHHVVYTYKHRDGTEEKAHLRLRMFERVELLALFEQVGLRIVHSAEDFLGSSVRPQSLKWVLQLERL